MKLTQLLHSTRDILATEDSASFSICTGDRNACTHLQICLFQWDRIYWTSNGLSCQTYKGAPPYLVEDVRESISVSIIGHLMNTGHNVNANDAFSVVNKVHIRQPKIA